MNNPFISPTNYKTEEKLSVYVTKTE